MQYESETHLASTIEYALGFLGVLGGAALLVGALYYYFVFLKKK